MKNLRIINVAILDSSSIDVTFTHTLAPNLVVSNVSIISDTPGVPSSDVLKIKVSSATMSIICQPLTPFASYFIIFKSVSLHPFQSLNGGALLSEDNISNKYLITAPLEADNPVKNYLNTYFNGNIYDHENDNTVIAHFIQAIAVNFSKALYDIRQVKNENYLSFNVIDEPKTRAAGPFDRLNEESAYEILRVGRTPTGASVNIIFPFEVFPSYPITLQKISATETLTVNSINDLGYFNINSFIANLNNFPITKINSIVFTLNTINPVYTYDISTYGYQILDSRYDQEFGFTYLQLENNQIKLNNRILEDSLFSLEDIIKVDISYEYKNKGIVVDPNTLVVFSAQDVIREVLPPIINVFNLKHAPIINSSNEVPILGGITFIDPNSNTNSAHPAFKYEIPFRFESLPSSPGQYSIDYATGTVYVYGNDLNNDGTGAYPPLATYKYRLVYQSEIDYIYDPDLLDIVSLPNGSLRDFTGSISFNYEEVFIPNIDYVANLHIESLTERVNNNLVALNAFKTTNSPITNVFKIFNETTGEIYTLNRWNNDKVYFRYNTPPKLVSSVGERATFNTIANELLFINTTLTNTSTQRIFKIYLNNNTIVSSTEDGIASFTNTSLVFSDLNIFEKEKWFDRELSDEVNIEKLLNDGEYVVDYVNGIIYCAVSSTQSFNVGSATYKNNSISPMFPHVIAPDDIYYQISSLNAKDKNFAPLSFGDGFIIPETLDFSDEMFLNETDSSPYQLYGNEVGIFLNSEFIPGVTNKVKFVRSLYEFIDLQNSTHPFNFAQSTVSNGFNIIVEPITNQVFESVQFDIDGYFVNLNENIPYISSNINYEFSIIRSSDGYELWDISGIIVPGEPVKLILSGLNSPQVGDQVTITYTISIDELSRLVVDYNKGDYYIDYTYLADEIIISYEYGDNVLDFRKSSNVPSNTEYFVSYKAGALRDALLKNFGTLVNVPELSVFDTDFNRERYREALMAALSSFIQGPTLSAIKNIGKIISHIEPEIIESAFINWSLGSSLLYPENITTTGAFQSLPAKFGDGVLINESDQTIKFPGNTNIRFEEGTFETWIAPQWNGLDNNAELSFNILKDGYAISSNEIFIGAGEYHPDIVDGVFSLNKNSDIIGTPNINKDGVFIYYDEDISGNFSRWYVRIIDGYVESPSSNYKFIITSTGNFYDSKSIILPKPSNLSIFTGTHSLTFSLTGGSALDEGITFLSDLEYYIFDFGKDTNKNRISIFKDSTGYVNFKIFDKNKISYVISADVSAWQAGDLHHVAASWKLNTKNGRDEMHLFLDGFEVPNIIKYGQRLRPYLHEKFRTVNPEEILGLSNNDIFGSIDLQTTIGSNVVTSSINFGNYNISIGNIIIIDEIGFNTNGYLITLINGQSLTLDTAMPATLSDGRFSINRTEFSVTSEIDVVPNIAVATIHSFITGTDITGILDSNILSSTLTNFITSDVEPGFMINISNSNLEIIYSILEVNANTLVVNGPMPINFGATNFTIYSNTENEIPGVRATRPAYSINKDGYFNNILTVSNDVFAKDLILIRTLGLAHRKIKKQYYVWGDNQENILMTQLPSPISLDETNITKIILPNIFVGPSNSTLASGEFTSPNFSCSPPSNSQNGRTLSVTIAGNNVDFSSPVSVNINGVVGFSTITETINFTDYGTLDTINLFLSVNYINVIVSPVNVLKNALTIVVKEKYTITYSELSGLVPVIRYSYNMGGGYSLFNDGYYSVRDENFLFSELDINNYLIINSPISVAGYYKITSISTDRKSIFIQSTNQAPTQPLPDFTNGVYQILNVNQYRSGLQNGFFTFEVKDLPSQEYFLNNGFYELEYHIYTRIALDPLNDKAYLGSNFVGASQLNGIIDQVKIYSTMLTDTRIGETIPSNQRSITKDFNSLKELKNDINTLVLINFNNYPFTNDAKFYINTNKDKQHFQSSIVINENFVNSLVFLSDPIKLQNDGILDTRKEGTIEFWMNPLFDTSNDPSDRYYFDAFGAVIEESVSINNGSIKLKSPASEILSVKLKAGDNCIDYFAGGKIEIDTQRAIQEEVTSSSNSTVIVSKPILQIITVKIVGDLTGTDYFQNGSIGTDNKTIFLNKLLPSSTLPLIIVYQTTENKNVTINTQIIRLNKKLPHQNTHVVVNYIPQGLQGDRISIFKDKSGYMNFAITASGIDYIISAPTLWAKNTWHRVKASYKINGGIGHDEMRLFLDGYQYTNVIFGTDIIFGSFPIIFGTAIPGGLATQDGYTLLQNIQFKDSINELFIGSKYTGENPIFSLLDNFRISNISRQIYAPYGEPRDVNYNSNLDVVFPVTEDLFTTYLMNFDQIISLNEDFAIIKNRKTGLFDFSVNILDSLNIVNNNIKSKEALEALIKTLKPANSKVYISYTQ